MLFTVKRTSHPYDWGDDDNIIPPLEPPVPGAVMQKVDRAQYINALGDIDCIPDETWTIEINTLEELIELGWANKDSLIVNYPGFHQDFQLNGQPLPTIEFYDDYRE
jgi:hypothetical protein